MTSAILAFVALLTTACGGSMEIVPLLTAAGIPVTGPTTVPLRVVTRSTAVRDPLRLRGTNVVYGDVEAALGHAISTATVPWADAHRTHTPSPGDGWQLSVEIINADALYEDGRVVFSLGVRATLRARAGDIYLGQSQTSCRQGGIVPADQGAPVMYRCMMEIGRDLAGWLGGVDLNGAGATSQPSLARDHTTET